MKHVNVVVSVIVAAAVLLAAYAIGLFIRQARMQAVQPAPSVVEDPNTAVGRQAIAPGHGAGKRQAPATAEDRALAKEQRAQQLEEASTLTDEDKQEFRDQVRDKFTARGREPRRGRDVSPEDIEQLSRRWENLSKEEQEAILARRRAQLAGSQPAEATTATPDSNDTAETSEPNESDSN